MMTTASTMAADPPIQRAYEMSSVTGMGHRGTKHTASPGSPQQHLQTAECVRCYTAQVLPVGQVGTGPGPSASDTVDSDPTSSKASTPKRKAFFTVDLLSV